MSSNIPMAPQGAMPAIGLPDSQDYPRLVFAAPYFEQVPLAELIEPAVIEAVENALPALVPPYVDGAAQAAVQEQAVLLVGSTMSGPLFLSPLMPTQPSQAATMAYVDSMVATAGIPEVPPVPSGQVWARETGQWVPITPQTGVFLPLSGGSMTGNISMSGNTIQNMAAVPVFPNGAAPAQWVLNQIASVSLYQGTWNADTNTPDLTQLSTHVNAYTWIAITTSVSGVVIGAAIPGLQGMTIFNGDTIIYSTVQGQFMSIHAGGLTLPEADERYVQLGGSQMSGALLLNANASQPLQAVTFQQLQTFVPPGAVTEAPNDGQLYGRNGLTASWSPVLPLAGGILTGSLTLSGNATANLNPVPLQQMTSAISAATAGLLPLAGGTMTGLMTLSGNAATNLNPVPLQQLNAMLGTYLPLTGGTLTGALNVNSATTLNPGPLTINGVAGTARAITAQSAGVNRWTIQVANAVAESGSNAGSDFLIASFTDAGAPSPAIPFTIQRSTGLVTIESLNINPGRALSVNTGNKPGWMCRDLGTTTSVGMWHDATNGLFLFGVGDVNGNPDGNLFWTETANGNFHSAGSLAYKPGGGSWTDPSDARIKTIEGNYEQSLAALMQLQPITFEFLGNDTIEAPPSGESAPYRESSHYRVATGKQSFIGFDAQSVQAVFPECVSETTGFIDGSAVSDLRVLDTSPLLYAIINAINQLGRRVEALDGQPAT